MCYHCRWPVALGTLLNVLAQLTQGWIWSFSGVTSKHCSLFTALFSISCPWIFSKWLSVTRGQRLAQGLAACSPVPERVAGQLLSLSLFVFFLAFAP